MVSPTGRVVLDYKENSKRADSDWVRFAERTMALGFEKTGTKDFELADYLVEVAE